MRQIDRGEAAKRLALPTVGQVSAGERWRLLGQHPLTVWLTGLRQRARRYQPRSGI